jgi:hypothetical protein
MILVFTLGAFIRLTTGVYKWMVSGWRHFHGRIWVLAALVVSAAMITLVGLGLFNIYSQFGMPEKFFFFLRATELTSGVSVLLPALLVGLAAFLSFFAALRRLNLAERMPCLRSPRQRPGEAPQFLRFDHERAKSFEGLKALEDRVKEMIVCPIFRVPKAALLTVLIYVVYWHFFQRQFIPSVDGRQFDLCRPADAGLGAHAVLLAVGGDEAIVAAPVMAPADFTIRRQAFRGEALRVTSADRPDDAYADIHRAVGFRAASPVVL